MSTPIRIILLVTGAVVIVVIVVAASRPVPEPLPGDSVVLLELFTSQGCSSCPPADRLLSEIASDPNLKDRVIPLAFHVDYWNRLGWTDPFSSSEFSARQRDYGNAFRLPSVYTPQVVIQGARQMVGSRKGQVREALQAALAEPLEIDLEILRRDDFLEIRWNDRREERGLLDLVLVVYENALVTEVRQGENRGRELRNDGVVRALRRIDRVDLAERPTGSASSAIRLSPDWNADRLGFAVFLQDPDTLRIRAAAETSVR